VDPLVHALRTLLTYTDKQYLALELREATTQALVAMANAEARICTLCGKNSLASLIDRLKTRLATARALGDRSAAYELTLVLAALEDDT
jgi:hypothetical protein